MARPNAVPTLGDRFRAGGDQTHSRGELRSKIIQLGPAWVLSSESFDPDPYLAILDRDGIHHATIEIAPASAFA